MSLTVVVPTWNRAHRLAATLPALLGQTDRDIPFIVLDNASHDDTWTTIQETARKDDRVKGVRQSSNVGPVRNIVSGLRRAESTHACVVSDDDYMIGPYVDFLADVIDEFPDVGVLHHDFGSLPQASVHPCYSFHAPSSRAAFEAFRVAGSISGLALNLGAWRNEARFDSTTWRFYPQVEWGTVLALSNGYIHLKGVGFSPGPWPGSMAHLIHEQARGPDLGLGERVEISRYIGNRHLRAKAINNLAIWARRAIQDVQAESVPPSLAALVGREVARCLSPYTPMVRGEKGCGSGIRADIWTLACLDLLARLPSRLWRRIGSMEI